MLMHLIHISVTTAQNTKPKEVLEYPALLTALEKPKKNQDS